MRKNLQFIFLLTAVVFLFSTVSFGQSERKTAGASKYVISAEAGGVNYVEGNVTVQRDNETSGYLLKGDEIGIGEVIETDADGKAEILLNPGSYARLGGDTSFEFLDNSFENLQLKLNRGSAIFEVLTTDGIYVSVATPKASFDIVKSGVYRVDVLADGTGKLEVWKGRAQIGEGKEGKVKKGRTATIDGDDVAIAKFDRGDRDSFEEWSKDRSKMLARANSRFERGNIRGPLISSFYMNRWNLYDSFGVWIYDPFWGMYTFLPFGYGWASPYGYRYRRDLWYCRLPRSIYYEPPPRRTPTRRTNTNNRTDIGAGRSINDRSNRTGNNTRRTNNRRTTSPTRNVKRPNRTILPANTRTRPVRRSAPNRVFIPRRSSLPSSNPQKRGKGN